VDKPLKPLHWIASSRKDMKDCPDAVKQTFGFALHMAQRGEKHSSTKPLHGFGGAGVLEILKIHDGDAYRAIYTVKFERAVYVLHVFQKKSKSGIATPKTEITLIKERLKLAAADYQRQYGSKTS
jgi:phage-related protein